MKNAKKVFWMFFSLFLLLGGLTLSSCSDSDDDNADTKPNAGKDNSESSDTSGPGAGADEAKYSITFEDFDAGTGVFTVAPGETKTLVVKSSVGTWLIDEENMPDAISVKKNSSGNFDIKGGDAETESNVFFKLYPEEAGDDTSFDIEIQCAVYNPKFVITLNLSDELAAKAKSLALKYSSDATTEVFDAEVAYTEGAKTATAALLKENANSYGYFNDISVTITDTNGKEIKADLDKKAWVCFYSTNAEYYNEINLTENTYAEADLTISFTGFTLSATDSIKVTYGITADSNTKTLDAVIAADGNSATATIGNDCLNSSGWFEITVAITKDGADYTAFKAAGNGWFAWNADGIALTLEDTSSETWISLVDGREVTASESFTRVLEPSVFENLSISKIKIATSGASTTWCANVGYENSWETDIKMEWDTDYENGYSTTITDADYIANIKEHGLYLAGDYTKFYVSYVE
ncbi:MAG: hypothetical protein IJ257_04120 [Treponema sp.]|nr:hypothetical protein [Treponema sp.]